MADENKTIERLEIQLEYGSFVSNLKRMESQYHTIVKNIHSFSADLGRSFTNVNRQVQNSIASMSSKVSDIIGKDFQSVRNVMNATQKDTANMLSQVENNLEQMNKKLIQGAEISREHHKLLTELENKRYSSGTKKKVEVKDNEKAMIKNALEKDYIQAMGVVQKETDDLLS